MSCVHVIDENLTRSKRSGKSSPVSTLRILILIQSDPDSLRPYASKLPSSENDLPCKAMVPSVDSVFGSKNKFGSSVNELCLNKTLENKNDAQY